MTEAPRLLDLFCGAGGAAMGYHRAGFDVTGVDNKPQKHYPFTFIQADALEYVAEHGHEYDAIHASPPCQAYSITRKFTGRPYLDLVGATRSLLEATGVTWIIENVRGAPIRHDVMLCGVMFGLKTFRHRYFESPAPLYGPSHEQHRREWTTLSHRSYSAFADGATHISVTGHNYPPSDGMEALGIDWTRDREELSEAIPPAYTEFIGQQLRRHLDAAS